MGLFQRATRALSGQDDRDDAARKEQWRLSQEAERAKEAAEDARHAKDCVARHDNWTGYHQACNCGVAIADYEHLAKAVESGGTYYASPQLNDWHPARSMNEVLLSRFGWGYEGGRDKWYHPVTHDGFYNCDMSSQGHQVPAHWGRAPQPLRSMLDMRDACPRFEQVTGRRLIEFQSPPEAAAAYLRATAANYDANMTQHWKDAAAYVAKKAELGPDATSAAIRSALGWPG